jgi:hypothetical protein
MLILLRSNFFLIVSSSRSHYAYSAGPLTALGFGLTGALVVTFFVCCAAITFDLVIKYNASSSTS